MTKTLKTITLSLLVALCVCFGFTAVANFSAYATGDMQASLNVGNDISLIVYSEIAAASDVKATFNWTGKEEYSDVVYGEKQGDTNTYKFTYKGLSAQYMAKTVTVTVSDGETTVAQKTVSVKELLEGYASSTAKTLGINSNAYKKLKTLSADILNYGKAAEACLGMTDDIGAVTGGTAYVEDEAAQTIVKGDLKWNAGVIFDYNLQPAAKVYIPAEAYKDTLVAKFNGNEVSLEATEKSGVYLVKYTEYNILTVDKAYTFEVFDGETSLGSLTTSFAALAKTSNADIVKAALVYGKSVVKYDSVLEDIDYVSDHIQAENAITGGGFAVSVFQTWQYTDATGVIHQVSGPWIANGAEGKYMQALSGNTAWVATINVTVPKAGEYDLRAMMQDSSVFALNKAFKLAVKQNGDDVTDSDYVVAETTDLCLPAGQWTNNGYKSGWNNAFYWTDASISTVSLETGENTVYVKAATGGNIPNIDYFYIKGYAVEDQKISVVNTRNTFTQSLDTHNVIGDTEDNVCLIRSNGAGLKELYKYTADDGTVGYPNNMTGLYMVIPDMAYGNYTQTSKVPVTEDMISGLDYNKAGLQKATITYGDYSTEAYFYGYQATAFEAEDYVYWLSDGEETDTRYNGKENTSIAQLVENGAVVAPGDNNVVIPNGSSGSGAVSALAADQNGKKVYFKFTVNVPKTGKYVLKARAAGVGGGNVENQFAININGEKDSNGNFVYIRNSGFGQTLVAAGQVDKYCNVDIGETKFTGWCNMFWWGTINLVSFDLEQGENEIRVYLPNGLGGNIDCFEIDAIGEETTSVINIRSSKRENLNGKVLTIKKGEKLTDAVKTPEKHPVKYTLLYLHTSTGNEIPVLGSMLEGKVDYDKVGEEQVVTVTDPVSGESASFTLLIEE